MNQDHAIGTWSSPAFQGTARGRYRRCYERIAEDDLVKPLEVNKHIRNIPLLRFIGGVRDKKVLDVGAGEGLVLDKLRAAAMTVSVDIAGAYLRVVRGNGHQAVAADGEALPFRPGSFDVVICSAVLEHVLDVEAVIGQVKRVLAPNGKFIVLVPWEEDLAKYNAFDGIYEFTHLRSFNSEVVRKLFRRFRIVRQRGVEPKVERPPNLKLLDALPRFVTSLFQPAGVDCLEEWFARHIPWRIRNRYWKWYWRQLEKLPRWDWLWLWFYPPFHMIFLLEAEGAEETPEVQS